MPGGIGAVDANGIYQYGEGDARSPFSDTLNLGQQHTSAAVGGLLARVASVEGDLGDRIDLESVASQAARDALWGTPASEADKLALQRAGARVYRSDLGWDEVYLATYDAVTNPVGATPSGWYPAPGSGPSVRYVGAGVLGAYGAGAWTVMNNTGAWAASRPGETGAFATPFDGTIKAKMYAGEYEVRAGFLGANATSATLIIKKNNTATSNAGAVAANSGSMAVVATVGIQVARCIPLAIDDYVVPAIDPAAALTRENTPALLDATFFEASFKRPRRGALN